MNPKAFYPKIELNANYPMIEFEYRSAMCMIKLSKFNHEINGEKQFNLDNRFKIKNPFDEYKYFGVTNYTNAKKPNVWHTKTISIASDEHTEFFPQHQRVFHNYKYLPIPNILNYTDSFEHTPSEMLNYLIFQMKTAIDEIHKKFEIYGTPEQHLKYFEEMYKSYEENSIQT